MGDETAQNAHVPGTFVPLVGGTLDGYWESPAVWPLPIRFDPDDRSTWPEDGGRVLVFGDGWWGCTFLSDAVGNDYSRVPCWRHDGSDSDAWFDVEAGDLWLPLPLPPTQGGEQ